MTARRFIVDRWPIQNSEFKIQNSKLIGAILLFQTYIVVVGAETLEGCLFQLLTEDWVGDRNQEFGPLLQRFAIEVHGAVLGYKPVNVVTGGDRACAIGEGCGYLA